MFVYLLACSPKGGPEPAEACESGFIKDFAGECVPARCGSDEFPPNADIELRPGDSIQAAADELGSGIIGLGRGTWRETIDLTELHGGLAFVGRCPELVAIDGGDGHGATVEMSVESGDTVTLRGITITGGNTGGLMVSNGEADLQHVALFGNTKRGIYANGSARVSLDDVTIADTRPKSPDDVGAGVELSGTVQLTGTEVHVLGSWGVGISATLAEVDIDHLELSNTGGGEASIGSSGLLAFGGSHVRLTNSLVEQNDVTSIFAYGAGTQVAFIASELRDTQPGMDASASTGITVTAGAAMVISDSLLSGNPSSGVLADGGDVTITNTTVLDTTAAPGRGHEGAGIALVNGATGQLDNVRIARAAFAGIGIAGAGASATVRHAQITDITPAADGNGGSAISMSEGSRFTGEDISVSNANQAGISAERDAHLVLRGCDIRHVRSNPSGLNGEGALIVSGATLEMTDCVVEDVQFLGFGVGGKGSGLTLRDVILRDVVPDENWGDGRGIEIGTGATFDASNLWVEGTIGGGITVDGGVAQLADVHVTRNAADAVGRGAALEIGSAAQVAADRVTISDNVGIGVLINAGGTGVTLTDLLVNNTRTSPIFASSVGIIVQTGAEVTLRNATVSNTTGVGIVSTSGADVSCFSCDLSTNEFSGAAAIGATLNLRDVVVQNTAPNRSWGGGIGVYARGSDDTALIVENAQISGNPVAGIWLDGPLTSTITNSQISGGTGVQLRDDLTVHGNAVYARGTTAAASSGVELRGTRIGPSAEIGVLLDGGSVRFDDCSWTGNTIDVAQQQCADQGFPQDTSGASTSICPDAPYLTLALGYDFFLVDPDAGSD